MNKTHQQSHDQSSINHLINNQWPAEIFIFMSLYPHTVTSLFVGFLTVFNLLSILYSKHFELHFLCEMCSIIKCILFTLFCFIAQQRNSFTQDAQTGAFLLFSGSLWHRRAFDQTPHLTQPISLPGLSVDQWEDNFCSQLPEACGHLSQKSGGDINVNSFNNHIW